MDRVNRHLDFGTASSKQISRIDINGTNDIAILKFEESSIGVSVDPYGGHLYWTHLNSGTVNRSNLDGSNPEVLVSGFE